MALVGSFKHSLRWLSTPQSVTALARSSFPRSTVSYSIQRSLSGSSPLLSSGSPADLERAKERVTTLTEDPGNEAKLKLYALYKQGTIGQCNAKRPSGMMDFVGKAKWDAWNGLGSVTQEEAIQQYCQIVDDLVGSDTSPAGQEESIPPSDGYKEIIVTDDGGARTITMNRPKKYNAINYQMYSEIQEALKAAGNDNSVVVAMITGAGDYYCSGNDLSNFTQIPPEGPQKLAAQARDVLREFVSSFIHFPKPLIAAVNGPAVGISVTLLGLCDLVYAAEHATFHTPFMQLGQSPEACSSVLFPRMMGTAKANEVLLGGKKLTAAEAYDRSLVTEVFSSQGFQDKVKEIVSSMARLPPKSLAKSKQLIRGFDTEFLDKVNVAECELLEERWLSEECMKAIMDFMQRKK